MKEFVDMLSQFGFPVVVAMYLLFRFEKKLDALEDTNSHLSDKLEEVIKIVEGCRGRKR